MTRERIEDFREIVLPFLSRILLKINYENMGKSDAEEFEKNFNEILDMAIKALGQEPKTNMTKEQKMAISAMMYAFDKCGVKWLDEATYIDDINEKPLNKIRFTDAYNICAEMVTGK